MRELVRAQVQIQGDKKPNKRRGAPRGGERRGERERSEPARQGSGMGSTNPNLCVTGSGVGLGPLNQFPPIGFTQPTRKEYCLNFDSNGIIVSYT